MATHTSTTASQAATTTSAPPPPLVDIGANLTNRQFQRDLPHVLQRAASAGVTTVLVTGTSLRGSRDAVALATRNANRRRSGNDSSVALFATVGVHPHDAKEFDDTTSLAAMRALIAAHPGSVVAVGECGLDFNRDFSPRDVQIRVFRLQVELACELQLPLFLHERDAHDAFVHVLQPFVAANRLPRTVVHCFTGSVQELQTYVAMGLYIGVTGYVCMASRGAALRAMLANAHTAPLPLDRLLIETDAPFMYPYAQGRHAKKTRCEPKDLRAVAQTLAECYRVPLDAFAAATTANARRFFALDARATQQQQQAHVRAASETTSASADAEERKPPAPTLSVRDGAGKNKNKNKDEDETNTIVLNGGDGEGGGQLLRVSVALASVLHKRVQIHAIRANRTTPGLRNQHVQTLALVRDLTRGSVLQNAQLHATQITFDATCSNSSAVQETSSGELLESLESLEEERVLTATSATGGSVALMVQGALPALVWSCHVTPTTLLLRGGTHAGFSPPADFIATPLLQQLLVRFGVDATLTIDKRSAGLTGGHGGSSSSGAAMLRVVPLARGAKLLPIDLSVASDLLTRLDVRISVFGMSAVVGSDASASATAIGQTFEQALVSELRTQLCRALVADTVVTSDVLVEPPQAPPTSTQRTHRKPRGGSQSQSRQSTGRSASTTLAATISVLMIAETRTRGLLTVDRVVRATASLSLSIATTLAADVAQTLEQYVADGVCVDEHLADNAIVFMALASGVSRMRVPSRLKRSSQHLETALAIVAQVAGARVQLHEPDDAASDRSALVEVHGIGWKA